MKRRRSAPGLLAFLLVSAAAAGWLTAATLRYFPHRYPVHAGAGYGSMLLGWWLLLWGAALLALALRPGFALAWSVVALPSLFLVSGGLLVYLSPLGVVATLGLYAAVFVVWLGLSQVERARRKSRTASRPPPR